MKRILSLIFAITMLCSVAFGTVTDQTQRVQYTASAAQTVFAYTWRVLDDGDMDVYVDDVLTTAYSVSNVGVLTGGNVTFNTGRTSGEIITILRNMPNSQETGYPAGGRLSTVNLELNLDRLTMFVQDLAEEVARATKMPKTSTLSNIDYPIGTSASNRANKIALWNSAGDNLALGTIGTSDIVSLITAKGDLLRGGSSGDAEAFPIGSESQVMSVVSGNIVWGNQFSVPLASVVMYRQANSTSDTLTSAEWKIRAPGENDPASWVEVSTAGTTTDGLQEAINYATEFGYDLEVYGGTHIPVLFGVPYGGSLGNDPFATVINTKVVTVTHSSHGLTTGDIVGFRASSDVNGIPAAEINVQAGFAMTKIDANSYTITVPTTDATSTGSDGGASVLYKHKSQNPSIINCTTGIVFPPMQKVNIVMRSVTINFTGAVTGDAIFFDSMMASNVDIRAAISAASAARVINIAPVNVVPYDSADATFIDNYVKMNIVVAGAGKIAFQADATNGNISSNVFDFVEINNGATGFKAIPGTKGFINNTINCLDIHGQTSKCLELGNATGTGAACYGNHVDIQCDPSAGATAIDVYGKWNIIKATVTPQEGMATTGINFQSSGINNTVIIGRMTATTPISGAWETNRIIRGGVQYVQSGTIGTDADTVEKTLMTSTLLADSLSVLDQGIEIIAFGSCAGTATVKTMKLYFGSTVISANTDTTSTSPNNVKWRLSATVLRTGASAQVATGHATVGQTMGTSLLSPAEDNTTNTTIKITGQNGTANANDIVCRGLIWKEIF